MRNVKFARFSLNLLEIVQTMNILAEQNLSIHPVEVPISGIRHPSPLWLTGNGAPVAAWLYQPLGRRRHVGVVLSSSIGIEALFGYPALIQWANALAANGVTCLRFDPPGSGDSDGTFLSDGVMSRWLSAFAEGADRLRAEGITDVVLAGVRLGALAAAAAAVQSRSRHLIAWAPYASGRAMMREMASFDQLFQHSIGPNRAAAPSAGMIDGAGTRFGTEFVRDLEVLRIQDIALPPAAHVLVIPRDDVPGGSQFSDFLGSAGADVTVRTAAGFAGAHDVPEQRTIPVEVFDASVRWIEEQFPCDFENILAPKSTAGSDGPVAVVHGWQAEHQSVEREVRFGDQSRLVGFLSEPVDGLVRGPGVVLVNAGLIHHVGPHRQWLEMARRWAALGIPSLRIDLGGIAGSAPPEGGAINRPYPPWAVEDVAAAMERLRKVTGVANDVVLVGLCAGAHNSFHAARQLSGIRAIITIDPINYYMMDSDPLKSAEWEVEWKTHAEYQWYTSRLSDPEAWRKLFSGQVNVPFVTKILIRKAMAVLSAWITILLPSAIATRFTGQRGDLGGDLVRIVERGTAVHMIFAGNAPGLWYLRMYARRALRTLPATGRFTLHIGAGADHTFSRWGWRRWLSDTITDLLISNSKRPS